MKQIHKSIKNKSSFLIPSTSRVDPYLLKNVVNRKDSVFFFDSSTLNIENLTFLKKNRSKISYNQTVIVIVANISDSGFAAEAGRLTSGGYFSIKNKLTIKELSQLNFKLDQLGVVRSKENKTLIENCYFYHTTYYREKKSSIDIKNIPDNHIIMLMILATDTKLYSMTLNQFSINIDEKDQFLESFTPFIEESTTEKIEIYAHSGYKLVLSSPSWAFELLGMYYDYHGTKKLSDITIKLVNSLSKERFNSIYRRITTFDNLNQIFHSRKGGVSTLIYDIYSSLEEYLQNESNYWLQRAKSILHSYRKDEEKIKDGIFYATKAYNDGDRRTRINTSLTLALLHGRLTNLQHYNNKDTIIQSINWYYEALIENKEDNLNHIQRITRSRDQTDLNIFASTILSKKDLNLPPKNKGKAEHIVSAIIKAPS